MFTLGRNEVVTAKVLNKNLLQAVQGGVRQIVKCDFARKSMPTILIFFSSSALNWKGSATIKSYDGHPPPKKELMIRFWSSDSGTAHNPQSHERISSAWQSSHFYSWCWLQCSASTWYNLQCILLETGIWGQFSAKKSI